jgi:hypothetical protein
MSPRLLRPRNNLFDPRSISGAVAWWKFDEAATNTNVAAVDSIGGLSVSAFGGPMSASGRTGRARRLTVGVSGGVPAAGLSANLIGGAGAIVGVDQSFTVCMWVKPEYALQPSASASFALSGFTGVVNSNPSNQWRLGLGTAATNWNAQLNARIYYTDGSFTSLLVPGACLTSLPDGVWAHTAVVANKESGTATFYINGVSAASASLASGKVIDGIDATKQMTILFPGLVDDLVVYNRALSQSEVLRFVQAPQRSAQVTAIHIEAERWAGRVIANGGTVSLATVQAVSDFCTAVDSNNLRSLLWRVNPMAGGNLSAALVPLYLSTSLTGATQGTVTDANPSISPFVAGDYSEASGLLGDGSSKRLLTGLPLNFNTSRHLACFVHTLPTSTFRAYIAATGSVNQDGLLSLQCDSPTTVFRMENLRTTADGGASGGGTSGTHAAGDFIMGTSQGNNAGGGSVLYANGVSTGNSGTGNAPGLVSTGFALYAYHRSDGTFSAYSNARIGGYSIGAHMNPTQALVYANAWNTMLRALGRKV